jgi:dipeptidyl-peptidase-4
MMINKFSATLFTALVILSFSSNAQIKDLSFEEIFNKPAKDILNPMPIYRGWADNTHYIEYRMEGQQSKPYTVDVRTGEAVQSAPAQVNEASVSIKNNDIYYKDALGNEKQLTRDSILEKNPTLSPDGSQVAFTKRNDLFSIDIKTGVETRYTNDGSD